MKQLTTAPHLMKILLATKGPEQSDIGKSFVMSEGAAEKNISISHCIDSCMRIIKEIKFDILIVGLDLSDKKGSTFIQRVRALDAYQFTPIFVGGNLTQEDICILLQQGVKDMASKPLTYEGFSDKYKKMIAFEKHLPEKEILLRKTRECMRQGNLEMAEKIFHNLEQLSQDSHSDLLQSLIGTDLFILKGDKQKAQEQLLFLKTNIEKSPVYLPVYEHRANLVGLMEIKQDLNAREGGRNNVSKAKTNEDNDSSKISDSQEKNNIANETGVNSKGKSIADERGIAGNEKEVGRESGIPGNEKEVGRESGSTETQNSTPNRLEKQIKDLERIQDNMLGIVENHPKNIEFAEGMAQISEAAGELEHSMDMYKMVLDINPAHDKAKIKYSDIAFEADRLDHFREYTYEQVEKDPNYAVSLDLIREMNKKAVFYINNDKQQRFKEGIQIYEDLLAWVNKFTEQSKEIRGKIWFNLATAYQKAPKPNPERRRRALDSCLSESPEGTPIKEKVRKVIKRDYDKDKMAA